jgi:hypothetical protein
MISGGRGCRCRRGGVLGIASLWSLPENHSGVSAADRRNRLSSVGECYCAVAAGVVPVVVAVVVTAAAAAGSLPAAEAANAVGDLAAVLVAAGVPNLVEGFLLLGGVAISGSGAGSGSGSGLRIGTRCCTLSLSAGSISLGPPLNYLDGVASYLK